MISVDHFGFFIYPLGLLSVLSLYIILERGTFFLFLPAIKKDKYYISLEGNLKNLCNKKKQYQEDFLSVHIPKIQEIYEGNLSILKIIASLSPMVGLLGTIIGMIVSFDKIAASNNNVTPSLIAEGMQLALYTTAYGLIICLISLTMFYFYQHICQIRIKKVIHIFNRKLLEISTST